MGRYQMKHLQGGINGCKHISRPPCLPTNINIMLRNEELLMASKFKKGKYGMTVPRVEIFSVL
jgi:hypothetical protein